MKQKKLLRPFKEGLVNAKHDDYISQRMEKMWILFLAPQSKFSFHFGDEIARLRRITGKVFRQSSSLQPVILA